MLFIVTWEAYPEKIPEIFRLVKEGKLGGHLVKGWKHVVEYFLPGGRFIEVIEAESAEAIFKNIYDSEVPAIQFYKRIDVQPAMTDTEFAAMFKI